MVISKKSIIVFLVIFTMFIGLYSYYHYYAWIKGPAELREIRDNAIDNMLSSDWLNDNENKQ